MNIFLLTFFFLICPLFSESGYSGQFDTVSFACMPIYEIEGSKYKRDNRELKAFAVESFQIAYSSFKKIASQLQDYSLKPKALKLPNSNDIVIPSQQKAVAVFYREYDKNFTRYLGNVAMLERSKVIVYFGLRKEMVKVFFDGGFPVLQIKICTYYADSNTLGFDYLTLPKGDFRSYTVLKPKIQSVIIKALEEAIVNASSFGSDSANTIADTNNTKNSSAEESVNKGNKIESYWN